MPYLGGCVPLHMLIWMLFPPLVQVVFLFYRIKPFFQACTFQTQIFQEMGNLHGDFEGVHFQQMSGAN